VNSAAKTAKIVTFSLKKIPKSCPKQSAHLFSLAFFGVTSNGRIKSHTTISVTFSGTKVFLSAILKRSMPTLIFILFLFYPVKKN